MLSSFLTDHIAASARELHGIEDTELRRVLLADMDGDGEDEVAVLYFIAGAFGYGNDACAYLAAFRVEDDDGYKLIHTSCIGSRAWRHVLGMKVDGGSVLIRALEFEGGEPLSSPSLKVTLTATMTPWGILGIDRSLGWVEHPPASVAQRTQ